MILGDASPSIAEALRQCGAFAVAFPGTPRVAEVLVDRAVCEVGVQCASAEDRIGPNASILARVFLRTDIRSWERAGSPMPLDAFLQRHEAAVGVLVEPWSGYPAPLAGCVLAVVRGDHGTHIHTSKNGRWRESRWIVRTQ